jgi:hypothetical protein
VPLDLTLPTSTLGGMGEARVTRSRLPKVASVLMILLGLITINFENVYVGVALTILGILMYLVYRRLGRVRGSGSGGSAGTDAPTEEAMGRPPSIPSSP